MRDDSPTALLDQATIPKTHSALDKLPENLPHSDSTRRLLPEIERNADHKEMQLPLVHHAGSNSIEVVKRSRNRGLLEAKTHQ